MAIQIKVTVPDEIVNVPEVRTRIERALRTQTGPDIRRNLQKTVQGWKNKPSWSQLLTNRTNYLSVMVWASGPNASQYGLVNAGSPAHAIRPKGGGMLRFQPGYRAGTSPGKLTSRSPQRSGTHISARGVSHPGFEARKFDEAVAEEISLDFYYDVQDAIRGR